MYKLTGTQFLKKQVNYTNLKQQMHLYLVLVCFSNKTKTF